MGLFYIFLIVGIIGILQLIVIIILEETTSFCAGDVILKLSLGFAAISLFCIFFASCMGLGYLKEKSERKENTKFYEKYQILIENNMITEYDQISDIKDYNDKVIEANEKIDNKWIGREYKDYADLPLLDFEKALSSYSYNLNKGIVTDK